MLFRHTHLKDSDLAFVFDESVCKSVCVCIARPPCLQQCNFLCAEMDLKTLLEKYSAFYFFVTTFDVETFQSQNVTSLNAAF